MASGSAGSAALWPTCEIGLCLGEAETGTSLGLPLDSSAPEQQYTRASSGPEPPALTIV